MLRSFPIRDVVRDHQGVFHVLYVELDVIELALVVQVLQIVALQALSERKSSLANNNSKS